MSSFLSFNIIQSVQLGELEGGDVDNDVNILERSCKGAGDDSVCGKWRVKDEGATKRMEQTNQSFCIQTLKVTSKMRT